MHITKATQTNRQKTTRGKYWRRKKRRLSTSEACGMLSSPSNQLIFPCLCYWSLLYTPFLLFFFPLAELIRRVNTEEERFFSRLLFHLNRQLRRLMQLLSGTITSLPSLFGLLSARKMERTIITINTHRAINIFFCLLTA
jgi:hypothetical protein